MSVVTSEVRTIFSPSVARSFASVRSANGQGRRRYERSSDDGCFTQFIPEASSVGWFVRTHVKYARTWATRTESTSRKRCKRKKEACEHHTHVGDGGTFPGREVRANALFRSSLRPLENSFFSFSFSFPRIVSSSLFSELRFPKPKGWIQSKEKKQATSQ